MLAGYIVAQASGQPYPNFLAGQVLAPLGLTATTSGEVPACAAAAGGFHDGKPVAPWPLSTMPGTGDIYATVGDLARFITAVHSGSLIAPHSVQAMITPHASLPERQSTPDGWATADS